MGTGIVFRIFWLVMIGETRSLSLGFFLYVKYNIVKNDLQYIFVKQNKHCKTKYNVLRSTYKKNIKYEVRRC